MGLQLMGKPLSEALLFRAGHAATAHGAIDMQQGFPRPGALLEVPVAREIVGNVNRISATLRQGARGLYPFDDPLEWRVFCQRFLNAREVGTQMHGFSPADEVLPLWPGWRLRPRISSWTRHAAEPSRPAPRALRTG